LSTLNEYSVIPSWHEFLSERIGSFYEECGLAISELSPPPIVNRNIPTFLADKSDLYYKGSQWHILSRKFVDFLLNSKDAKALLFYLKNTYVPDEAFYAILVRNFHKMKEGISNLPKVINDNMHFTKWSEEGILCEELESVSKWPKLFFRKFVREDSLACADTLREKQLLLRHEPPPMSWEVETPD